MARLTITQIRSAKPGKHSDGDGLFLNVDAAGNKRWTLRGTLGGKRNEWGLGAVRSIGLAEVREKAAEYRKLIRSGVNPKQKFVAVEVPTFAETAVALFEIRRQGWRNPKHAQQWINTLTTYAFPKIGAMPVDEIGSEHMLLVLQPIWIEKPETARRVRQRMGAVIDYATVMKWRNASIPVRGLGAGLPQQPKQNKHHAALPVEELPHFIATMRETLSASTFILNALEFTILTAARSGEVRLAQWSEFDLNAGLWTIPGERMKAGEEHRVPLTAWGIELLGDPGDGDALVFGGTRAGKPLSNMSLLMPIKRAGFTFTVHGFRSTFRDWCAEETNFSREVAEKALAHTVGDKTERAYRRGDLLEKRITLMEQWGDYCQSYDRETSDVLEA